ncbi:sugar MFS transporter [Rheinheimera texasensis]|uniref:sugar MFS transporter n=1 Tax=Rheinheimera texasensis TaxID=306205 RepID=UPI0004E288AE|nr:sugar MFS transporter [Rheinheimera texasensis]
MAFIPAATSTSTTADTGRSHFAFLAMTSLFFIWGFVTALNDILIPHLKAAFALSYTQAMLVQLCFFGAYFLLSPLAGRLIERIGFLGGILAGLVTLASGCLLFYPAAELATYPLFLTALFVLAGGVTLLQVSANPYVAALGSARTAASRLSLAQAVNSLGHTLAPLFGAALIFAAAQSDAKAVQLPYLLLAGFCLLVTVIFARLKLPVLQSEPTNVTRTTSDQPQRLPLPFYGAVAAIFLYVGAEVSIGSFLINYLALPELGAFNEQTASTWVSYYWGGAMLGRFAGAVITRYINALLVLALYAVVAIALLLLTMSQTGMLAAVAVISIGFFNSIMFPTIFTHGIAGLGNLTSRGSGLLCQAIVGGALVPLMQGVAADSIGVQHSFIVPLLAYVYIAGFAGWHWRQSRVSV